MYQFSSIDIILTIQDLLETLKEKDEHQDQERSPTKHSTSGELGNTNDENTKLKKGSKVQVMSFGITAENSTCLTPGDSFRNATIEERVTLLEFQVCVLSTSKVCLNTKEIKNLSNFPLSTGITQGNDNFPSDCG